MTGLASYRRYYEQTGLWEQTVCDERIGATAALAPADAKTILDVGCGNGAMLDALHDVAVKVGVDISAAALGRVRNAHRIIAEATNLPFREGSFELVVAAEVLEHIPPPQYPFALDEIRRVASRYVLVSVPFDEDIQKRQTRCAVCGLVFHVHLHVRSFAGDDIPNLFPDFALVRNVFSGPLETSWPTCVTNLRRRCGRWEWDRNAMCPRCGASPARPRRSAVSVLTSIVGDLVGRRHRKWVSALYEKRRIDQTAE